MSKLLIHEYPLTVLPSLATKIGLNEAIVLQQIHYWLRTSPHVHDGKVWVYNSYDQWQRDNFPFWSTRTIKRIMAKLEDMGIVESTDEYNPHGFDRTKWYTINPNHPVITESDNLSPREGQTDTMQRDNMAHSSIDRDYPETTAEITSSTKPKRAAMLSEDWTPSTKTMQWATSEQFSITDITEQRSRFVDHHLAKGKPMKDWDRAFMNWMRNARDWGHLGSKNGQTTSSDDDWIDEYIRRGAAVEAEFHER